MRKKNYQPSNFFDYLETGVCVSLGKGRALEVPGSMALKVGAPEPGCFFPYASTMQLDGKGHPGFLKGNTCCRLALSRPAVHTSLPLAPQRRHSLARLIQKPPSGALAAHEDVLLQGLLMEHPVAHAEGRVTWRKAKDQCGPRPGESPAQYRRLLGFITRDMACLLNPDTGQRAAVRSGFCFV